MTHPLYCELETPLNLSQAQIEASRCYYCYDAPCIQACPTAIDVPSFIRKIGNGNLRGAAKDILSANILGGTCARVCPVETLCQQACVREKSEAKPVAIGQLQRFAIDSFFNSGEQPFERAPATGITVAVVGAGPAGLSCAHKLATLGYDVAIYEDHEKPGGLNEYGLAPYKMVNDWAQEEIRFILSVGGITIKKGTLGRDLTLSDLSSKYSAVFLGVGLGDTNTLSIPGEGLANVLDAAKFIAQIRQAKDPTQLPIGRNVVVIGGGNTAIDIAVQMKRLGSDSVTLVYRRGTEEMGATPHEQEIAQTNGVLIKNWAMPTRVLGTTAVSSVEFEGTQLDGKGKLVGTGARFELKADQVFKAIGQKLKEVSGPALTQGKIRVNAQFETSLVGVYAGGDCIFKGEGSAIQGEDLTVTAVQHGKLAALAIHQKLSGVKNG